MQVIEQTIMTDEGPMYRWVYGDTLAMLAVKYCRPASDWKILYQLNSELYFKRHNKIQEGDLLKIPPDWFPIQTNISFDRTKIDEGNQDYSRESYLLKMFGQLKSYKEPTDA